MFVDGEGAWVVGARELGNKFDLVIQEFSRDFLEWYFQ